MSFKSKQKVRKPKEEWYRVENTHEAIIAEEDFYRVREMIDIRRRQQKEGTTQIFSGLIKCADCGWSLGYGRRRKKDGFDGYYHCSKNGQGLRQCSMHYIRFDNLYAYVLSRLQYWSMQAQRNEDDLLRQLMGASDKEHDATKKKQADLIHRFGGEGRAARLGLSSGDGKRRVRRACKQQDHIRDFARWKHKRALCANSEKSNSAPFSTGDGCAIITSSANKS